MNIIMHKDSSTTEQNIVETTIEEGFIRAVQSGGLVCYITSNLNGRTPWGDYTSIIVEESGLVRLTRKKGDCCFLSNDLQRQTHWGKFTSAQIEDGHVWVTHKKGAVRLFTLDFDSWTDWADSIRVMNGVVTVVNLRGKTISYTENLEVQA
jgi:hypothetical protein